MQKSRKYIFAAVLVVALLVAGMTGAVLAQDDDGHQGRRSALAARVAEILNIDQQDFESAFKQAQGELREEALDSRLQELIDEGTLTQEQADELKKWMEAKPDVPIVPPRMLQKLVDEGKITQEQVDELKEWMEARPDVPRIRPDRLEKLINRGVLTQKQADEVKEWMEAKPDGPMVPPKRLQELVDGSVITQQQADELKEWMEARPDVPMPRPRRPGPRPY